VSCIWSKKLAFLMSTQLSTTIGARRSLRYRLDFDVTSHVCHKTCDSSWIF